MKYINCLKKFCLLVLPMAVFIACSENVDTSARYVFKYDTILSYLQKHEAYSTYVDLLGKVPVSTASSSTVGQLMSARGNYTVFAPTNDAIQQYLAAIRSYQQNLDLAKQSAVLTETELKDETQAVLNAQINAAGVGVAAAREALDYYKLTSPIDGVVTAVSVQQYGMSAPGYPAFTVSDQNSMTVTFSVSQSVRDTLRVGSSVLVDADGKTYYGVVTEIAYTASPYSGLFPIKASISGARGQLLTGTTVSLTADTYSSLPGALLVPYDAVYYEANQAYVFCDRDGVARRVDVTVGLYNDTTAAVTSGLLYSDRVIVTWSPRLRDGAPVRATNSPTLVEPDLGDVPDADGDNTDTVSADQPSSGAAADAQ